MRRGGPVTRTPRILPVVDFNETQTWNGPLAPANFRMLVDLSDTANWRHSGTNYLILYRSFTILAKDVAGSAFLVGVGPVLATDPVSVTIAYLEPMSLTMNADDPQRGIEERYLNDFPLSLQQDPPGKLKWVVAGAGPPAGTIIIKETAITNGTTIANAAGVAATVPAVGDLVMRVLKTSAGAGATLRVRQFLQYVGA